MKVFIFPVCRAPNYAEPCSRLQFHNRGHHRETRHSPAFGIVRSCRMRHERRTCAKLCHSSGGELEQIQFFVGACNGANHRALSWLQTESQTSSERSLSPQHDRFAAASTF
jgi:hypothetical protein